MEDADRTLPKTRTDTFAGAVAVVEDIRDRQLIARTGDGSMVTLRRAVSCLIAPLPGDRVLTAEADGETYVIAVLERSADRAGAPLRIETDGDIDFVARRVSFRASIVDIASDTVNMMGDAFNALFRRSKRIIGNETLIAKSTTLRTGERVSIVAGADIQEAAVASQTVAGPIAINAQAAILTAKSDIRLNGERINVG